MSKISKIRSRAKAIPPNILSAIRSGHVPKWRNWRELPTARLTTGERVCRFIETFVPTPEGPDVGKLMKLLPFQEIFVLAIFDGPVRARKAILSIGRKGGKTALAGALLLAFMFMDGVTTRHSRINSGALSREQAALVFNYMAKSIAMSPRLSAYARITPSGKKIVALNTGIEYHALAAEAGKSMGLSPVVLVGDEWGQVTGPSHPFIDALMTSQGAHDDPLAIVISTQAPSDADFLSIQIDDATRSPSDEVVCHLYTADIDLEITDSKGWMQACPAIGVFRSRADVRMQAQQAKRLPVIAASFENLILNRRVALISLWLAPQVWKENAAKPVLEVFQTAQSVGIGLDLSQRNDLTAAVLSAMDGDGVIHLLPFVFAPEQGMKERELRDRAPYTAWVRDGFLIAVPGATLDYDYCFAWLKAKLEALQIRATSIHFDRWRIKEAQGAAARAHFNVDLWVEVGQGMQSMSPRIEYFETLLLQSRIRHGAHPLLNMAAACCIVEKDAAGNRKPEKSKSTQRIDPLVAAVMAAGAYMAADQPVDVGAMIA